MDLLLSAFQFRICRKLEWNFQINNFDEIESLCVCVHQTHSKALCIAQMPVYK